MLSPTASGLVGLIVIESTADSDEVVAQGVTANDATLAAILRWLAGGLTVDCGAMQAAAANPRLCVRRFALRAISFDAPARVAADCRALGDQLERATRQLRRRIARAGADAKIG
jgi:hypothetical protein